MTARPHECIRAGQHKAEFSVISTSEVFLHRPVPVESVKAEVI